MTGTKNMNLKIVAVAAVVVLIIAAVAVLFVTNDNNKTDAKIDSELNICGNADRNETIDNSDLAIINDIINGAGATLSEYPLADANNDSVVDSKDVEIVEKLINREPTAVYVVCLNEDGNQTVVKAQYPVKNIVPVGTNMIDPILNIGGTSSIAGYFYSGYANVESVMVNSDAVDLKGTSRSINDAAWKNFTQLDSSLSSEGGVGALVVDQSVTALNSYRSDIVDAQIPEIRFAVANAYEEVSATLTIGFLLGGDVEKKALQYAQLS